MEVAGEVKVDFIHRKHLGVAAATGTSLHAEAGAERRLTKHHHRLLSDVVQAERQTDAHGGFSDAGFRGADGCHQDQVRLLGLLFVNVFEWNFGHIVAVWLQVVVLDT